jgi:hypothetical protein
MQGAARLLFGRVFTRTKKELAMKDRRRYLKVKIKSLAAEAKIIRQEERKSGGRLRNGLHEHRVGIVRSEARHSLLAYGFLRGRDYSRLEKNSSQPNMERVRSLIEKFGPCWDHDNETYPEYQARVRDMKQRADLWVRSTQYRAA